jgi:hypothetical protein
VKLDGKEGLSFVNDALDRIIIQVTVQDLPVSGQSSFINGEAVILAGDTAAFVRQIHAGLIVAAVTKR